MQTSNTHVLAKDKRAYLFLYAQTRNVHMCTMYKCNSIGLGPAAVPAAFPSRLAPAHTHLKATLSVLFRCAQNKMDLDNLAVVFTPNLFRGELRCKLGGGAEEQLQRQVAVLRVLISQAAEIGERASHGCKMRTMWRGGGKHVGHRCPNRE